MNFQAASLEPVRPSARVLAVDVLRGFAVLGILAMNIVSFALPADAYVNPMNEPLNRYAGTFAGANRVVWYLSYLLIDMKMMSIFSMLFGAGVILMHDRAEGGGFASIYYRRLLWLLLFGLVHAYFIWYGDILTLYAMCGLLLYPVRRWRPAVLTTIGVVMMMVTVAITALMGAGLMYVRSAAEHGDPEVQRTWAQIAVGLEPKADEIDAMVAAMRGSFATVWRENAKEALFFQLLLFPTMMFWRALGLMLVGMGLMKLGVFTAAKSIRFYMLMILLGYGLGLPLIAWGAHEQIMHRFDMVHALALGWHFNYVGSLLVALAHVGVVMLVAKTGVVAWLTARLAAAGRMALTNYLCQSLMCTAMFYGWGFGLFGRVERKWFPLFVVGIWVIQLFWSPWWLRQHRFGPMEWLWRSLTYWKRQPMQE
jgi:uncharacterized protein